MASAQDNYIELLVGYAQEQGFLNAVRVPPKWDGTLHIFRASPVSLDPNRLAANFPLDGNDGKSVKRVNSKHGQLEEASRDLSTGVLAGAILIDAFPDWTDKELKAGNGAHDNWKKFVLTAVTWVRAVLELLKPSLTHIYVYSMQSSNIVLHATGHPGWPLLAKRYFASNRSTNTRLKLADHPWSWTWDKVPVVFSTHPSSWSDDHEYVMSIFGSEPSPKPIGDEVGLCDTDNVADEDVFCRQEDA